MKSLLIIVPYDHVYPPMNGGMQRCFHIINQLATYFDLSLIVFQEKNSFLAAKEEYPAIANIKIYSTKENFPEHDVFCFFPARTQNALRYRWITKQLTSSADSMFLEYYPVLKKLLIANKYDGIILENLSTLNAVGVIRKYNPNAKIIYDAHNVDSNLSYGSIHEEDITKVENTLYKKIDALFTCSETDRIEFERLNNRPLLSKLIPNGVIIGNMFDEGVQKEDAEFILFCGSLDSVPNSEGLLWFYNKVWESIRQLFPQLKLLVVGSGKLPGEAHFLQDDKSLVFSGRIEKVEDWYNKAAISIVPLFTGSGTRLKILEAMSLGLPVISTSKGAEGIQYTNGKNIVIADEAIDFANKIEELLGNQKQRKTIARNARKLVEAEYDWNVIGKKMHEFVRKEVLVDGK